MSMPGIGVIQTVVSGLNTKYIHLNVNEYKKI